MSRASLLDRLVGAGSLPRFASLFAETLLKISGETCELLELAAGLAACMPMRGDIFFELQRPEAVLSGERHIPDGFSWPETKRWRRALENSPLVSDGRVPGALVLDPAGRLYLRRYWQDERDLAARLLDKAEKKVAGIDLGLLREGLDRLFGVEPPGELDLQRAAAALAVKRELCIVSGGPGTGKTTTVARMLILLQEQARRSGRFPLRVMLMAPTGKAAQRMGEALGEQLSVLEVCGEIEKSVSREPMTIHRALGIGWNRRSILEERTRRSLRADVVVVDEASMVSLELFARLVAALSPRTHLILLGDRDQLASVEAGSVFGDLCGIGSQGRSHAEAGSAAQPRGPLGENLIFLQKNWRFGEQSLAGRLALSVRRGHADNALEILEEARISQSSELCWVDRDTPLEDYLGDVLWELFADFFQSSDPSMALEGFARGRILCAHRRGRRGVEGLNLLAQRILSRRGQIVGGETWYPGRPILVTENNYQLGLFNGDTGVVVREDHGGLSVCFRSLDGTLRSFATSAIPPHQTAYAITVHKSQGSEADRIVLVLPERPSPVMTRELLYTGLTRARQQVTIVGSAAVITAAVKMGGRRSSGLRERLWGA